MHQLPTLTVSTDHDFRVRTLAGSLTDELCHQCAAAVRIPASEKSLHTGRVVDSLHRKVVCSYDVCEGRKEWGTGECAHVALFCGLWGRILMVF